MNIFFTVFSVLCPPFSHLKLHRGLSFTAADARLTASARLYTIQIKRLVINERHRFWVFVFLSRWCWHWNCKSLCKYLAVCTTEPQRNRSPKTSCHAHILMSAPQKKKQGCKLKHRLWELWAVHIRWSKLLELSSLWAGAPQRNKTKIFQGCSSLFTSCNKYTVFRDIDNF